MVCHFKVFKGCLPQILLCPFLNTFTQLQLTTNCYCLNINKKKKQLLKSISIFLERLVLQLISCLTVIRVFNSWWDENTFSYPHRGSNVIFYLFKYESATGVTHAKKIEKYLVSIYDKSLKTLLWTHFRTFLPQK